MGDRSAKVTYEPKPRDAADVVGLLNMSQDASLSDIFFMIFDDALISAWLGELRITHPQMFVQTRGRKRHSTHIQCGSDHVLAALAARILLHAQQQVASRNQQHPNFIDNRFADVVAFLSGNGAVTLPASAQRLRKMVSFLQIKPGSALEARVFVNLRKMVAKLGEVFAGDEKLYHADLLKSGMVKIVLSKPARVGVWGYEGCIALEGDYPLCIYLRIHFEIAALDENVRMIDIMKDWVRIIEEKTAPREEAAILVADSHYPTIEALQFLRQKKMRFIFACDQNRFQKLSALISQRVQKTGDMAFAEKVPERAKDSYELMSLIWSRDSKIGKRLTITNALQRVSQKRKQGHFPGLAGNISVSFFFSIFAHEMWEFRV
jgi:hypothetical protein